jgi:hypothetical protein
MANKPFTNNDFNWTFPVAIGFLGAIIGLIYLAQRTTEGWGVLIAASVAISILAAFAANGGVLGGGKQLTAPGSEGQGSWVSRPAAVFALMLIITIGISIIGHYNR